MRHKLYYLYTTMFVLLFSTNLYAFDCEVDGIYYNRLSADEFEVTSGTNKYTGDVVIPETVMYREKEFKVTQIGNMAFDSCKDLISVSIPQGVTILKQRAFMGCSSLTSITIPQGVNTIESSVFSGCTSITSIAIPESVSSIGSNAFQNCSSLTSISIPEGVTSLQQRTFSECYNLTSVTLPESLTEIRTYVFWGCSSLTSITIPKGVKSILRYAFTGCSNLSSIKMLGPTEAIYDNAFQDCTSLISINLPYGLWYIGENAFQNCSNLTEISIPQSLTQIGTNAFSGCTGLKKVIIKDIPAWCKIYFNTAESNPLHYAQHLYSDEDTEITELVIPYEVTNIRNYAFYKAENLSKIYVLSGSVPKIEANTFGNTCYTWTDLKIPNNMMGLYKNDNNWKKFKSISKYRIISDNIEYLFVDESVGRSYGNGVCVVKNNDYAYSGDIKIPESITFMGRKFDVIGISGFQDCTGLTSIEIPNSVKYIGSYAFSRCKGLTYIDIPSSVIDIGYYTFEECKSLTSVTIPSSVTSIGVQAFMHCESLTSITIPNSVTNIGDQAFASCFLLTSVTIPSSVKRIRAFAFSYCGLTSITISNSDTNIERNAFAGNDLTTVTSLSQIPPTIEEENVFSSYSATLQVPTGSKTAYQNAAYWKNFTNIVEIDPSGIQTITLDKDINAPIYDLNGRKLKEPSKGINIIGGKKVIVK